MASASQVQLSADGCNISSENGYVLCRVCQKLYLTCASASTYSTTIFMSTLVNSCRQPPSWRYWLRALMPPTMPCKAWTAMCGLQSWIPKILIYMTTAQWVSPIVLPKFSRRAQITLSIALRSAHPKAIGYPG